MTLTASIVLLAPVSPAEARWEPVLGRDTMARLAACETGGNLYGAADITERGWTDSRADLTVDTTSLSPEDAYRVITDKMEE